MKIHVVTTVPYPRDAVFAAMRDQLPALAAYMPNIASIVVEQQTDAGDGVVDLVNKWQAAASEIPMVARGFVKPEQVYWHDHAHWDQSTWKCDWKLIMGFMTERVKCSGATTYHQTADGKTEMRIDGTLELDLKGLVPRLLLGKAQPAVEGFVGRTLEPNFQKTAEALTAYLDGQKAAALTAEADGSKAAE
jgi:nitrogen fixation protein